MTVFLAISCPKSPDIIKGTKSTHFFYVNTVVEYKCNSGYQVENTKASYVQTIVCTINSANGIPYWNGIDELVNCIPVNCEPPPNISNAELDEIIFSNPINNMNISENNSTYFLGTQVYYTCFAGYRFSHTLELSAQINCSTVSSSSHIAAWEPNNINCIRMKIQVFHISYRFIFHSAF